MDARGGNAESGPPSESGAPRRWRVSWLGSPSAARVHPQPRPGGENNLPTLGSHDADGHDAQELQQQQQRGATVEGRPPSSAGSEMMAWSPHPVIVEPSSKSVRDLVQDFFADDAKVTDKWHSSYANLSQAGTSTSPSGSAAGSASSAMVLAGDFSGSGGPTREVQLIMRQYLQGLLASMFIAALNVPMVYGLAQFKWHEQHPADQRPVYTLNTSVYDLSLLLQCVFPLSLYALVLYVCIKGTWRVPRALLAFVFCVASLAITVALVFWKFNVPFQFYSGDFVYIALTYVPSMCAVGWFLSEDGASNRERLHDLLLVALLETVVAAAAILYCQLLMPLFFMVNAWMQLAWVCILHPIYFEVTTTVLLRIVLRRNAMKGRTNVRWFLSIVHAAVHSVSISSILTSSIDSLGVTVLTQVLCSASKLGWRSTTNLRDVWVERVRRWDFSFTLDFKEHCQQNRLVTTGILTEMILENACNVLAPWLIWCTWHVPLFMSVAPEALVEGGTYPVYYVICLILILVVVTATFDLLFLVTNYMGGQELPVIQTFREMRKDGAWYLGFLAYALTFMGVMFLFITMILVPRAVFCTENDYCTCRIATLQGICDGQYISTWGGNIVR